MSQIVTPVPNKGLSVCLLVLYLLFQFIAGVACLFLPRAVVVVVDGVSRGVPPGVPTRFMLNQRGFRTLGGQAELSPSTRAHRQMRIV